jgi:hypothetical protein
MTWMSSSAQRSAARPASSWIIGALLVLTAFVHPVRAETPDPEPVAETTLRFGMLVPAEPGGTEFKDATTVPSKASFGVQVLRRDDSPYRLLIVITAPGHVSSVEGGLLSDDSGDTSVVATQGLVYQGTVMQTFSLDPQDPLGRYQLDVYVDGVHIGSGKLDLVEEVSL